MLKILKTEYTSRVLALLLAFALCFGFVPAVYAMEGGSEGENSAAETPELPESEVSELPESEEEPDAPKITSGTCGTNLSWNFADGVLTISGSGPMRDFPEGEMAPWYALRNNITALVLPEGMTSVGDLAFYRCKNITSVSIPNSVTQIGWHAFDGCIGITMLNLGNGIRVIEEAAFKECSAVRALRIPGSVNTIGFQAFSWCESLSQISIPASVTAIEEAAFAFCKSLIRVEILAQIEILPSWIFFGCSSLTELLLPPTLNDIGDYALYNCSNLENVVYTGDEEISDSILENANEDSGSDSVNISDSSREEDDGYFSTITEDDGSITIKESSSTDNSTISSEQTIILPSEEEGSEGKVEFSDTVAEITVENSDGWDDVIDYLEGTENLEGSLILEIFLKDDSEIPQEVFELLAGRNVVVKVNSASGAVWQFDGSAIAQGGVSGLLITHSVSPAEEKHLALMGCQTGYRVEFSGDAEINAEVLIRLPVENAKKTATLYGIKGNKLTKFQTVLVDNEGYAHFYLGSVSKETVYLIGINVPGEENSAIIPQNMLAEYGNPEFIEPIKYEITGRTSSWGMNLGQVMSILAVVMVSVIVVVGAVMFFWNRQRLKNGYVPQMDDDE